MFVDLVGNKTLYGEVGSIAFFKQQSPAYTFVYMHGRSEGEQISVAVDTANAVRHYNELLQQQEIAESGRVVEDGTYTSDMDDDEKLLYDPGTAEEYLRAELGNQVFETLFTPPREEEIQGDVGAVDDETEESMRE
jgi:hypothetical protein